MMVDIAQEIDEHLKNIASLCAKHKLNKFLIVSDLINHIEREDMEYYRRSYELKRQMEA